MPKSRIFVFLSVFLAAACLAQESGQAASETEKKLEAPKLQKTLAQIKNLPAEYLIGPYIPDTGPLIPLTAKQRADVYFHQTYLSFEPYFLRLFSAGVDQARGYPSQWGGGMAAFGERYGNRFGRFVVANSVSAAGNALAGYEPRYDLCRCRGFWPRTRHAIVRNFVTFNNTEQELRPQFFSYAGAFASGAVSSQWLPGKQGVWHDGGLAMLSQAGYGTAYNFVSEFAVDILHKITKHGYSKGEISNHP